MKDASLKHIHSQVLQNVLLRLERTFQNYHRDRNVGQPRFKRYGRYNSITYPQYGAFSIMENKLKLSFVNGLIKIKIHRIPVGTIKTCTIIRDIDRWFACITTTTAIKNNTNIKTDSVIGLDVGLTNWITLSDGGQVIDRPRFLKQSIARIKSLQRNLSRKKKGSKNRNKARIHLAKAWRKVRLQRQDYCHKVTTDLTKRYRTLIFEKLSIGNMVRNHNLATSILDATWYKIKQLAAYKAEVYQVPARNTTQMCSNCGCLPDVKKELNNRIHDCLYCGLKLDRDHNAAINVLNQGLGLGQTFVERKPLLVSNIEASKLLSMKQEAHELIRG